MGKTYKTRAEKKRARIRRETRLRREARRTKILLNSDSESELESFDILAVLRKLVSEKEN